MAIEKGSKPTQDGLEGSDLWDTSDRNPAPGTPKPAMTDAERLLFPDTEVGLDVPDDVSSLTDPEDNWKPGDGTIEKKTGPKNPNRNKLVAVIGASTVAVLGIGIAAGVALKGNDSPNPSGETVATAPAQPNQQETQTPAAPESPAVSPSAIPGETLPGNTQEVVVPTTTVEAMDAMTDIKGEYANLGIGDRAAFAMDKQGPDGLRQYTTESDAVATNMRNVVVQWNDATELSGHGAAGAKALSILYYDTAEGGINHDNYSNTVDIKLASGDEINGTQFEYVDSGSEQQGLGPNGEAITFTNVTANRWVYGNDGTGDGDLKETFTAEVVKTVVEVGGVEHPVYSMLHVVDGHNPAAGSHY